MSVEVMLLLKIKIKCESFCVWIFKLICFVFKKVAFKYMEIDLFEDSACSRSKISDPQHIRFYDFFPFETYFSKYATYEHQLS